MSINRIDFQGAFLNTGEQHNIKTADNSKLQGEQVAFQSQFDKQKSEEANAVTETPDMFRQQSKFDAREKGKNEYRRPGDQRKGKHDKKKEDQDQEQTSLEGDVRRVAGSAGLRRQTHGFDFKV